VYNQSQACLRFFFIFILSKFNETHETRFCSILPLQKPGFGGAAKALFCFASI
jgi:hypothetical protein